MRSVPVTKDQVRFIINSQTSQGVFGTPFGNSPRNPVRDEITNIGELHDHQEHQNGRESNFEFHTTFLNALNHPNFGSVDPFVEDAGDCKARSTVLDELTQTNGIPRTIYYQLVNITF